MRDCKTCAMFHTLTLSLSKGEGREAGRFPHGAFAHFAAACFLK